MGKSVAVLDRVGLLRVRRGGRVVLALGCWRGNFPVTFKDDGQEAWGSCVALKPGVGRDAFVADEGFEGVFRGKARGQKFLFVGLILFFAGVISAVGAVVRAAVDLSFGFLLSFQIQRLILPLCSP